MRRRGRWFLHLGCLASLPWVGLAATAAPAGDAPLSRVVDFNRDVRPILAENCYACHGPDEKKRKSELRLDTREGAFADRGGYHAIVAGDPEESELYRRITAADRKERMPPASAQKTLSEAQIALIRRWIEQGARWQRHWSLLAPQRPPVPEVADLSWPRNTIDFFILARLEAEGLAPAPESERRTLVRRLSFDLTGVPPAPEEVDAFLADESPDAFNELIGRLLASPQYGERMAMHWLDLVRFADTNGIHGDNHREHTPYRDYVIKSFNDNLPFDRFTVEQLAGDLLPDPTMEQKVASGYNRLNMTTREGGAQPKEYVAKYAADRVRNASTVWMAATLGCAECHDHKFDPYLTEDFYSFAAFFADLKETAVGKQEPVPVPTPSEVAQVRRLVERIVALRKVLDTQTPELDGAQARWELSLQERASRWRVLRPLEVGSENGAVLELLDDGSVLASGASPDRDTYTFTARTSLSGISALRLEVLPDESLPEGGPGRAADGNFVLSEIEVTIGGEPLKWSAARASHSQKDRDVSGATDGKAETGWAILEHAGRANHAVFETEVDAASGGKVELSVKLHQGHGSRHTIGRLRLAVTDAERPLSVLPHEVAAILATDTDERTEKEKRAISAHYRSVAPKLAPTREELADLERRKKEIEEAMTRTLVSISVEPRVMRVLPRGNWLDDSGEIVTAAVPASLSRLNVKERRATRLDLAGWLVARDNPMVARVLVNRLWGLFFGRGIVATRDDFGSQGAPPTHPRLLDWLAIEFMESGWDIKHMVRLMVSSATYRQSSHASAELRRRDPYNRLLARQGRFRLDAEMVRDNALVVSGLLSRKMGGRSVKPYQPSGYWSHLNFPRRVYKHDKGEEQYRRGLYTYWARTFLHPSLLAFDAPSREECTVGRSRSNTPLQALVLLNDPTYVEAARVFAERILREGGTTSEQRLDFAFREALARKASPDESKLLLALYRRHLEQYRADETAAGELISTGERPAGQDIDPVELAAWMSVTRVLFNLHETITRY